MRQIGPYQILDLLGKGGMGEVYLAEDTRLGRKVALKLLPSELTNDQRRVLRFQQEARTASALNHPNILTIFDIGEVDSTHFIATEFVKGETLRHCMSASRLNLQKTLNIIIQVASALGAAHEVGVVHRDIKPENIMVRPDGLVKVLDFGIAKLTQGTATGGSSEMGLLPLVNTEPGMVMGTPKYMSPEQVRALDVDQRTDIFSLGAVLHEMMAGKAPFERRTVGDTIAAILKSEPPPMATSETAVPAELQEIVFKTLRKDRDERYQTMGDLIIDLRSLEKKVESDQQSGSQAPSAPSGPQAPQAWTGYAPTIVETMGRAVVETRKDLEARSGEIGITRTASSAEYIVSEIKQHKRGSALIVTGLVLAAAAVIYFASGKGAINSVAVLPFVNASNDPEMEYLSDGVSDSLINSLSRLGPRLKVMSRSSSFKYKGKEVDPQEVAKTLGVQAIVTGRVMQHGDQLQVSAELTDTRDKTQMWGDKYTRRASDLLAVQSEISEQIAEKLRLRLTTAEKQQFVKDKKANPEAYDLWLKGVFNSRKSTPEGLEKAVDYYNEAIKVDPNYANAYAGLAKAYLAFVDNGFRDPKDTMPKAEAAARKAMELDESLADAHSALAAIKKDAWDWAGAEKEFKRAIELNPNLATARRDYSTYLSIMGRFEEAIAEVKLARELDPSNINNIGSLGVKLENAGQYDKAIEQFRELLGIDPNNTKGHVHLGYVYAMKRMYPEAIAEYKEGIKLTGGPEISTQSFLGYALAMSGRRNEAQAILKELLHNREEYVSPAELAILYAGLGSKEEAFAALDRAYNEHDPQMQYLKVERHYDSLRSDPRFTALMRKVGFPP